MIYLGCSGWYYTHWLGKFYPQNLDKKEWLKFYSKKFNTVEVNATFYHLPFKNMLIGWYRRTPKNFILTLKASRIITHIKRLKNVEKELKIFYSLAELLKEKLGCILFQTPPSLKKDLKLLESFLKNLDKKKKNVIEFRHKSWYSKDVYDLLKKYKVGYCIVSAPSFPTEAVATTNFAYVRWHGSSGWYKHNYPKKELKEWAKIIKDLKKKCKDIYGYFNNDYEAYAPKNCLELRKMLK